LNNNVVYSKETCTMKISINYILRFYNEQMFALNNSSSITLILIKLNSVNDMLYMPMKNNAIFKEKITKWISCRLP